ncbi:MAG: nucleotidyltransferase family protein [Gammaproteobacteria bacterium]|nr:nucleotidyltransferase family protein [Gammaproteobacteria bacterium]MBU1716507.1 nucleotidyltransferase family protein [Pseudomonadota bacterium]
MDSIRDDVYRILADHKGELTEKFHVKSLSVFGSVSKGVDRPDSDIDILVSYHITPGMFAFLDLKEYLESLVGRTIDLVTEGALKKQLHDTIIREANRVT